MYRFTTPMIIFTLALGFQSAHAAPPQVLPSVVVHFGDLDLSNREGAKTLYKRLRAAAHTVCAPLDEPDLATDRSYIECMQSAISTAVAKVDRPALTAYYEEKTNGRKPAIQIAQNQDR